VPRQLLDLLMSRVETIIGSIGPGSDQADRQRAAVVVVQIFPAMLPVIEASAGSARTANVRELKRALRGYIASLDGTQVPG
jgi:hypothetical protein